jgi:prephenate dehydrogenase
MTSERRRVGVVGSGLIGCSVAMAAARAGDTVIGFDRDPDVLAAAADRSALRPADSVEDCAVASEVIFVCTPIDSVASIVTECLGAGTALVTDVGSVKAKVVVEVEARAPSTERRRFVGGHPMGGSERGGPESASASLVEGVAWVLTPAAWTDPEATATLEAYVRRLGAHPVVMDPDRHDTLVALVSHLPQVTSSVLMEMIGRDDAIDPDALALAGSGFRDVTRLAGSDPELWSGILGANRDAVVGAIDMFVERLNGIRDAIAAERSERLQAVLAEAQRARAALGAKPQVRAGVAVLQIPVPDRPGVLAELTSALGAGDVNIEDLQIVHSPWGPSGLVHLTVLADRAEAAAGVLTERGFEPFRVA